MDSRFDGFERLFACWAIEFHRIRILIIVFGYFFNFVTEFVLFDDSFARIVLIAAVRVVHIRCGVMGLDLLQAKSHSKVEKRLPKDGKPWFHLKLSFQLRHLSKPSLLRIF